MEARNLAVEIVRFVDQHQPGWVACEFTDAVGRRHAFIDKAPVFTNEALDANSVYPRPGVMTCEVVERWTALDGRELARVSTANLLAGKSAEGLSEFVVAAAQLVP
jgi:hypothetical protein